MGFTSSNKLALMVVCDFFFLSVVLDKGTLDALYTDTSDKVGVVTLTPPQISVCEVT